MTSIIKDEDESIEKIQRLWHQYPPLQKHLSYGTAGFRDRFDLPLNPIFARIGILACLRSQYVSLGSQSKCVGTMVTASHNPEIDNGVKVVDVDGGMLAQSWESYTENLANASTWDQFIEIFQAIRSTCTSAAKPVIVIGRDTRFHSHDLSKIVIEAVNSLNGIVFDIGECTTPQLHFVVQELNLKFEDVSKVTKNDILNIVNSYFRTIGGGFVQLKKSYEFSSVFHKDFVIIDASFGVGTDAMQEMFTYINGLAPDSLDIELRNKAHEGKVNDGCGAEHVQKGRIPPCGVDQSDKGNLLCSFDGDADRIVFHSFLSDTAEWILLDGDKIASLIAVFLFQELVAADLHSFPMGVVQTAYANGASTSFLKQKNITIAMAKTGVKYLHHKALEFDIGVYFEANGHGTVIISKEFQCALALKLQDLQKIQSEMTLNSIQERMLLACNRLTYSIATINQAVGDAISDMLISLACLKVGFIIFSVLQGVINFNCSY